MEYRMEHDTMGEVAVPAEHHWGAQTQRSRENFKIGGQRQPKEIITAFAYLKDACAQVNAAEGRITPFPPFAGRSGRENGTTSSLWWYGRPAAAPRPT